MSDRRLEIARADLNEERGTLEVTWGDGHASSYPLKYLRAECPCATCRTERQEALDNPFRVLSKVPSAELTGVEPVGRYGMRLHWGDGHAAGIYTFEYLRGLCPCQPCIAARPPESAPYVHGIYIPG
ncbi:MAG TPA: DUF971 domain-containing protein [Armatimonadota bacterium]|nr:DUF971 domain-containing protein [Armatimonadota bacterium]